MITAGIAGASGYAGGELLRCLLQHPQVKVAFIHSHSHAGKSVAQVHQDLFAYPDLFFTDEINPTVDVLLICLGHGQARKFLTAHAFSDHTRIIDLSHDFRLQADAHWNGQSFVYGLVEWNKAAIQKAKYVANPGCFATAIQLAVLPLAKARWLREDLHIHAITGATGAGQSLSETSHFSWRSNNLSIYKAFSHQHLGEIGERVRSWQPDFEANINFLPLRGDFTRGIFASVYMASDLAEAEVQNWYAACYADAAFTHISPSTIHLKQVVNTNYCLMQVQQLDGKILITSIIDNLLKGAAGQAIQNMNLMFGLEESAGLQMKGSYF
ncbi:MAG TPA: N-acetyl-gamma-glutamyl-phosphate reductase [Saprospiraceae bacterium]|nr:N-acetyl-gamma-glutamyl-phosphate reductase [Saprospiraceae bacterium]HMQ83295.1 N-acetyl-gamma-glutamyl-phosphate reductase [Saprospiraceae bacterium]